MEELKKQHDLAAKEAKKVEQQVNKKVQQGQPKSEKVEPKKNNHKKISADSASNPSVNASITWHHLILLVSPTRKPSTFSKNLTRTSKKK